MELIRIQRDDSPDGVLINARDFNSALHKVWVKPKIEHEQIVEIAGLTEPLPEPEPLPEQPKKRRKRGE